MMNDGNDILKLKHLRTMMRIIYVCITQRTWMVCACKYLLCLVDDSRREICSTGVDRLGFKSSTLKRPFNSRSVGQLFVAWPMRSHKAHRGMTLGALVWVAITCLELVVPQVFLDFPPMATPFPILVVVDWACVDSVEDIRIVLVG
jgi:hypothetical protein